MCSMNDEQACWSGVESRMAPDNVHGCVLNGLAVSQRNSDFNTVHVALVCSTAAACTTVANYSFTHAKTSPGGDIPPQLIGKSAVQLTTACNEAPGCVGFTSSGWLKSRIKAPGLWDDWPTASDAVGPCNGLFVRTDYGYEGSIAWVCVGSAACKQVD